MPCKLSAKRKLACSSSKLLDIFLIWWSSEHFLSTQGIYFSPLIEFPVESHPYARRDIYIQVYIYQYTLVYINVLIIICVTTLTARYYVFTAVDTNYYYSCSSRALALGHKHLFHSSTQPIRKSCTISGSRFYFPRATVTRSDKSCAAVLNSSYLDCNYGICSK